MTEEFEIKKKEKIMNKHFKAIHKETKEEIEFGLEDIRCSAYFTVIDRMGGKVPLAEFWIFHSKGKKQVETNKLQDWIEDYDLYYNHKGIWYEYE